MKEFVEFNKNEFKNLVRAQHLSIHEVIELTGIPHSTLGWCCRNSKISRENLRKLQDCFPELANSADIQVSQEKEESETHTRQVSTKKLYIVGDVFLQVLEDPIELTSTDPNYINQIQIIVNNYKKTSLHERVYLSDIIKSVRHISDNSDEIITAEFMAGKYSLAYEVGDFDCFLRNEGVECFLTIISNVGAVPYISKVEDHSEKILILNDMKAVLKDKFWNGEETINLIDAVNYIKKLEGTPDTKL